MNAAEIATQSHSPSGITEIVMAHCSDDQSLVLPMLAHLSQQSQDKWFTWVAPRNVSKSLLASYGFASKNVRLVHTANDQESKWVLWDALANGNSETVVADLELLSDGERQKLEQACTRGNTRGLILRTRKG